MSYRNFYACPTCKHEWDDVWDCMVDEECSNCGERGISPARSKNLEESMKAKREYFTPAGNADGTWYVNAYRTDEAGTLRRETLIEGISEKAATRIADRGNEFVSAIREAHAELESDAMA